jgi:hypothetical protein
VQKILSLTGNHVVARGSHLGAWLDDAHLLPDEAASVLPVLLPVKKRETRNSFEARVVLSWRPHGDSNHILPNNRKASLSVL